MDQTSFFGVSGDIKPKRISPEGPYTQEFETFWKIHPEGGKRPAFRAFLKAIPSKIKQVDAEGFLRAYRERKVDDRFSGCNLSTWLNGEYWEQEKKQASADPNEWARSEGARIRAGLDL